MRKGIALLATGLATLGAFAVSEAAEASTARYCGTTADGFPGLRAVGPTSCGFAKRVGNAWERKHVPLYEIRASMWMPRPAWVRAYSPKMHWSYRMYCRTKLTRESPYVTCTGGNGARVDLVS
jgi:hypothetical protein